MKFLRASIMPVGLGPECWGLLWIENEKGENEPVLCGPDPSCIPGMDDEPTRNQVEAVKWAKARWHFLSVSARPVTEPTAQGLQFVIPGCEKDHSRGPKQMSLF